jgi:hypothetical protein
MAWSVRQFLRKAWVFLRRPVHRRCSRSVIAGPKRRDCFAATGVRFGAPLHFLRRDILHVFSNPPLVSEWVFHARGPVSLEIRFGVLRASGRQPEPPAGRERPAALPSSRSNRQSSTQDAAPSRRAAKNAQSSVAPKGVTEWQPSGIGFILFGINSSLLSPNSYRPATSRSCHL